MRPKFPRKFHCFCGLGQRIRRAPAITANRSYGGLPLNCVSQWQVKLRQVLKCTPHRGSVHPQVSRLKKRKLCVASEWRVPKLTSAQHKCFSKACPDLHMQFPPPEGAVSHSAKGLLITLHPSSVCCSQPYID